MSTKKKNLTHFGALALEPAKPSLFGGFSALPVISTDPDPSKTDLYVNYETIPSRNLGKNFSVAGTKTGRTPDAFFSKQFLTLASPTQNPGGKTDTYEDPERAERRAAKEQKAKNIDKNRDFKYSSPGKKAVGLGSYFGTLQGKPFEHQPDYTVPTRDSVKQPEKPPKLMPRNFVTNPGKKGTFGFPNTTFGPPIPYKGDDFAETRKRERAAWEAEKKKQSGPVWRPSLVLKKTFDEKNATGVSSIFDQYEKPPEKSKKKRRKTKKEPKQLMQPVFKYSAPPKTGLQGLFDPKWLKRPEGDEADPYGGITAEQREEELAAKSKRHRRKKKAPPPKKIGDGWKPPSGAKSSVVRSLLRRFY